MVFACHPQNAAPGCVTFRAFSEGQAANKVVKADDASLQRLMALAQQGDAVAYRTVLVAPAMAPRYFPVDRASAGR
jgi:hypothetical protein